MLHVYDYVYQSGRVVRVKADETSVLDVFAVVSNQLAHLRRVDGGLMAAFSYRLQLWRAMVAQGATARAAWRFLNG